MSELKIILNEHRTNFRPGEEIVGRVEWTGEKPPARCELRLIWFTKGPQIVQEARTVQTICFDKPQGSDRREFRFQLPDGPYSYLGKRSFLNWGLELLLFPSRQHVLWAFNVTPSEERIFLFNDDPED